MKSNIAEGLVVLAYLALVVFIVVGLATDFQKRDELVAMSHVQVVAESGVGIVKMMQQNLTPETRERYSDGNYLNAFYVLNGNDARLTMGEKYLVPTDIKTTWTWK